LIHSPTPRESVGSRVCFQNRNVCSVAVRAIALYPDLDVVAEARGHRGLGVDVGIRRTAS